MSSGSSTKPSWLHVDAADYLARNDDSGHQPSLRQKLHSFLILQGKEPTKYPFAYLLTAPRVFGYSFNPVSFWYLYSIDHELEAMILEVNNTFDERRMYFLEAQIPAQASEHTPTPDMAQHRVFSSNWQKDFHVSPFNSRKGSYALRALDIHPFEGSVPGRISNSITLTTSDGQPKLNARISSMRAPVDATKIGAVQSRTLILQWFWVGFVTFPRILREACKLYFRRGLHVWFRPEVTSASICRQSTALEK